MLQSIDFVLLTTRKTAKRHFSATVKYLHFIIPVDLFTEEKTFCINSHNLNFVKKFDCCFAVF